LTPAPGAHPRRWPPAAWPRAWRWAGVVALVAILAAAGVLRGLQGSPAAPFAYKLRVLGSSELADMAPILGQAARATGVTVEFTPIGSVLGSQDVLSGKAQREGYDAVWFASDSYLDVFGGLNKVVSSTPIMESPVILGVRSSVARGLGWDRTPPTWRQVASAAEAGRFTFGMTDPAMSNSGLSAIVSLATTVAGRGAALQESELTGSIRDLTHLFHGQVLKRPSSGFLTDAYLKDLEHPPAKGIPDGIFDYESQLITLQHEAPPSDPLTLIYPSDQALTADY
jgi:Ca-activated chloride channel homolog